MQIKDHILIADYLLMKSNIKSRLKQKVFLLGCIQPDFNPLSYLKGSLKNKILHGHNYGNSLKFLKRKIKTLQEKDKLNLKDYYQLGKIIHYVADDFTYPHNSDFPENVIEHRKYKKKLHLTFEKYIKKESIFISSSYLNKSEIFNFVIENHDAYLKDIPSIIRDCKYIVKVCVNVITALEVENHQLYLEVA